MREFSRYAVLFAVLLPFVAILTLTGCAITSPLIKAARRGDKAAVESLLSKGADINNVFIPYFSQDVKQPCGTLLGVAAQGGHVEIVKLLLERGADVNGMGHFGGPPMLAAAYGGQVEVAKLLLEAGADVNSRGTGSYQSALCYAVQGGHLEMVELLLLKGADFTGTYKSYRQAWKGNQTLVEIAAGKGYVGIVRLIKEVEEMGTAGIKARAIAKHFEKNRTAAEAAEKAGDEARQAGDSEAALSHYVAAIKDAPISTEFGFRLRKKILKYALTLKPKPAIPRKAKRHVNRGYAFLKRAKSVAGYQSAVAEFEKAVGLAPWSPRTYFNLGLVQEKAQDYSGAIRSFKLYLIGSPDAPDARKVRQKIDDLEVAQEMDAQ